MPDIMENIDVIASLRGAQNTLFDLVDEPELIKNRITQITNIYYDYFNQFYEEIKEEEGGNAYAVFQIWGPGRTVKLQCDFRLCCHRIIFVNLFRNPCAYRLKRRIVCCII